MQGLLFWQRRAVQMTMSKVKIQRLRYMTPSFTPLSAATSVRVSDAPTVADAPRHCADVHACPLQVTRSRRYEQTLTSGDQEMFSGKNCVTTLGALCKWRLSLWVAISSLPGAFLMPLAPSLTGATLASLFIGVFLCSGSANTFNQVLEVTRDAKMVRTMKRPLPSKALSRVSAIGFGTLGHFAGSALLWYAVNPTTALLAGCTTALYLAAYTPLKVRTPYNTHIGAVVGALPTLLGATSNNISLLSWSPWMLFIVQLLWQFPHFYTLAWQYREDYRRGGFKAFPLSDHTGYATARLIMPYLLCTFLLPFLSTGILSITDQQFIVNATAVNGVLYYFFRQFQRNPNVASSRNFFSASLWHLLILLSLVVVHTRRQSANDAERTHRCNANSTYDFQDDQLAAATPLAEVRRCMTDLCVHSRILTRLSPKRYCVYQWVQSTTQDSKNVEGND